MDSPRQQISRALFTLNFFNFSGEMTSAEKHWEIQDSSEEISYNRNKNDLEGLE